MTNLPVDRAALKARLFERVNDKLKPPRRVYAVLDAARAEPIFSLFLKDSPKPPFCLYRGDIAPELREVAPHLVELVPDDEWTDDLLRDGWGKAWGVFVEAALPEDVLARHLRSFLRVKSEDGRKLVFRWYDPRVLRVYLPTTTTEEAKLFGGPLARWMCEDADSHRLLTWERTAAGLEPVTFDLDEEFAPSTPLPFQRAG